MLLLLSDVATGQMLVLIEMTVMAIEMAVGFGSVEMEDAVELKG